MALNSEHPDAGAKPGDKRTDDTGIEWTFGSNQYSAFWRAGPKNGTVICSKDYPGFGGPYRADGMGLDKSNTFDYAASIARKGAKREYERAKSIVERYEAPEA